MNISSAVSIRVHFKRENKWNITNGIMCGLRGRGIDAISLSSSFLPMPFSSLRSVYLPMTPLNKSLSCMMVVHTILSLHSASNIIFYSGFLAYTILIYFYPHGVWLPGDKFMIIIVYTLNYAMKNAHTIDVKWHRETVTILIHSHVN